MIAVGNLAVLALLLAAGGNDSSLIRLELAQLQGEWTVVSEDFGCPGKHFDSGVLDVTFDLVRKHERVIRCLFGWLVGIDKWVVKGDRLTLRHHAGWLEILTGDIDRPQEISYRESAGLFGPTKWVTIKAGKTEDAFSLEPTKKPKWIDGVFGVFEGSLPAVYELRDDRLRLAIPFVWPPDEPAKPSRPTGFSPSNDTDYFVVYLRRSR